MVFHGRCRIVVAKNGCWLWEGTLTAGYAHYNGVLVHRYVTNCPPHLQCHHTCRTRRCVNPAHIQHVTAKQHREAEGRSIPGKFWTCGHEQTPENTYEHTKTGWKYCRACNAKLARDRRAKRLLKDNPKATTSF